MSDDEKTQNTDVDAKRKRDDEDEEETTKRAALDTEEKVNEESSEPVKETEEAPSTNEPATEETPAPESASSETKTTTETPTTETETPASSSEPVAAAPAATPSLSQPVMDAQQAAIQAAAHAAAQAAMAASALTQGGNNPYGLMSGLPQANPSMGGGIAGIPRATGAIDTSILVDCPQTLVGRVIGKGGETIRDLQLRSGCQIQVDQNFPEGQPRKISVQGSAQNVELAKQLINNVFNSGPQGSLSMMGIAPIAGLPAESGPTITKLVDCPQTVVGRVIGKGGETIKLLQMQSGCRIQIDQNFPEGMPRKITIQGSPQQVAHASSLVDMKINEGGTGGLVEGKPSIILDCPKTIVGRVIGRGGETINLLQQQSGARIQIDQKVPEGMPCKVEISGDAATTEVAIKLVTDLINGGNPAALGGGNMPPGGGMGGGMRMGGMGGYPPQQQHYGGGGYPPQQQPQGYGGYPPQQQGGYQAYTNPAASTAPPMAASPRPVSNWSEHDDGSGNKYWYNSASGQSQWEKPADA